MRTRWGALCLGIVAVSLVGCGRPAVADDLLYMQTPRGVTLIRAGSSTPVYRDASGVPSGDWTTVVQAQRQRRYTRVTASIPASSTPLWEDRVFGGWRTKVVSEDGNLAALGPANEYPYIYGRNTTHLSIVGSTARARSLKLRGNFEPEAFSTDGTNLFVLQYRPALAPTTYQVRRLDLVTGRVHDVFTPDAHRQERMQGTARVQASSGDGRRLYTLYTTGSGAHRHAFIHALSLDKLWAHCIDLPAEFALAAESAGLDLSPDGKRLFVVNSVADALAVIDTSTLEVLRTRPIDLIEAEKVHVVYEEDRRLYLGVGRHVFAVDETSLRTVDRWRVSRPINGLQLSKDLRRLYVGLKDQILVLDAASGDRLDTLDPKGVGRISTFGRVTPTPVPIVDKIVCAC